MSIIDKLQEEINDCFGLDFYSDPTVEGFAPPHPFLNKIFGGKSKKKVETSKAAEAERQRREADKNRHKNLVERLRDYTPTAEDFNKNKENIKSEENTMNLQKLNTSNDRKASSVVMENVASIKNELINGRIVLFDTSFLLSERMDADFYDELSDINASGKILLLDSIHSELQRLSVSDNQPLAERAQNALDFMNSGKPFITKLSDDRLNVFGDLDVLITILTYKRLYAFSIYTNDTDLAKDVLLLNQLNSFIGQPASVYKLYPDHRIGEFKITNDFLIPGVKPICDSHRKHQVGLQFKPVLLTNNVADKEEKAIDESKERTKKNNEAAQNILDSLLMG